jgi:hypothetical protein
MFKRDAKGTLDIEHRWRYKTGLTALTQVLEQSVLLRAWKSRTGCNPFSNLHDRRHVLLQIHQTRVDLIASLFLIFSMTSTTKGFSIIKWYAAYSIHHFHFIYPMSHIYIDLTPSSFLPTQFNLPSFHRTIKPFIDLHISNHLRTL